MEEIKDGYIRVSQIIGQWNQYSHINPDVLANKCRIGTEVHEKIAAEMEGIYLEASPDCEGYLDSWSNWFGELDNMKLIATEKRLYCDELKITGAIDGIVQVGAQVLILDYKTSANSHKKTWALQASFYHYLAEKNGYDVGSFAWFVHLRKDGKKAKVIEIECTPALREAAMSAYLTYKYFND